MKKNIYLLISITLGILTTPNHVNAYGYGGYEDYFLIKYILVFGGIPSLLFAGILYLAFGKNKRAKTIIKLLLFCVLFLPVLLSSIY